MIRSAASSLLTPLAAAVRLVPSLVAGLIVVYAAFTFFAANPTNPLVEFTSGVRDSLGWFTKDLFTPADPKIAETINAVLAAVVCVLVGNLLSKAITTLAPGCARAKI
ncbi:hypothetical protein [Modestobacter sp. DSM 44400]|uniref:hypothetical protein n=1 Tax=Modestobacter sp. DSM 44400 TaxID=1550230 RepID=UPI0011151748|nr:hypothetical protein [Modestobacter sp. DSM 44400]